MKPRKPARSVKLKIKPELLERITTTARELYVSRGFSRIKMDDVAEKLGISKKTLYLYFPSKEALFEAALLTTLDAWKQRYAGIAGDQSKNCLLKLRELTEFISYCYSMMSKALADDLRRYAPRAWDAIEDWRREMIFKHLAGLLAEGVREGYFKEDVNRELGLVLYYEFSRSVLTPDFITRYPYSAAQVSAAVSRLFFDRLLTSPGRAILKEDL